MSRIHSFPPIEAPDARILILGSMPGKESLQAAQYYAHSRNIFWNIMEDLIGAKRDLPYESRIEIVKSAGIALWDVLASCQRHGSMDADIDATSISSNDLESFLLTHPHISYIFFNGAIAEKYFRLHMLSWRALRPLHYQRLPSTSPAYASMPYQQKLSEWEAILHTGAAGQSNKK